MGMESYYFSFHLETRLSTANMMDLFRRHYKVRPYDPIRGQRNASPGENRISLDNRVVLEMKKGPQDLSFTFEVCFSNYWSNLMYLYEIAHLLMKFGPVELRLADRSLSMFSLNFSEFCAELNRSHAEKYALFVNKYGTNQTKSCLPIHFYKFHQNHRRSK